MGTFDSQMELRKATGRIEILEVGKKIFRNYALEPVCKDNVGLVENTEATARLARS